MKTNELVRKKQQEKGTAENAKEEKTAVMTCRSYDICNAPLFKGALRRSTQKMQTSFFKSSLCALEKRGALQDNSRVHSVLRTVPALPDRLSLKVNPSASVNFHPSFQ